MESEVQDPWVPYLSKESSDEEKSVTHKYSLSLNFDEVCYSKYRLFLLGYVTRQCTGK